MSHTKIILSSRNNRNAKIQIKKTFAGDMLINLFRIQNLF